jgi:hypothetical protein
MLQEKRNIFQSNIRPTLLSGRHCPLSKRLVPIRRRRCHQTRYKRAVCLVLQVLSNTVRYKLEVPARWDPSFAVQKWEFGEFIEVGRFEAWETSAAGGVAEEKGDLHANAVAGWPRRALRKRVYSISSSHRF